VPSGNQIGPTVGSASSFGVDLATFGLAGGADATRVSDASTAVIARD
jgi:hypothetical protein